MAVSLHHQGANLDRARLAALTGHDSGPPPVPQSPRDALLRWIHADRDPRTALDSLPGVLHHLGDAWRRRDRPNIVLLHYTDLHADLGTAMRGLAARLGLPPPGPDLVAAAGFARMRARAGTLAPNRAGVLKDPAAFFRRGGVGAGRELLTDDEYAGYLARAATLAPAAPPALLDWLHRTTG